VAFDEPVRADAERQVRGLAAAQVQGRRRFVRGEADGERARVDDDVVSPGRDEIELELPA
jgi:hypothetical protein